MKVKENLNKVVISVEEVRRIAFKKITKGIASLSKAEKKVFEVWDFEGNKIFKRTFRYEPVPIDEIRRTIAAGLPPRTVRKVKI